MSGLTPGINQPGMQWIDADSENTWPAPLLRGLEACRDALAAFHLERARIDRAAEDDVMLREYRPSNSYQAAWDAALALAERTIASHRLLGLHATRLTELEVEEIRRSGLRILSVELLQSRVAALQAAGALTAEHATRLGRNQAAAVNRSGRTCFCFTRKQLKHESSVARLFRSWGGEALYNSHESDPETGRLLKGLGSPCIVVAAVRVADVETYIGVGHRLLNIWCAHRGIGIDHRPEFEGHVRTHTPGENILRIVTVDDPEFLTLTAHDKWRNPLA